MLVRQQKSELLKGNVVIVILTVSVFLLGLITSLFRCAQCDEVTYLHEAMVIADCLQNGQWFGNEAVGLHGFLFKIPAALLVMLFGHSIFAITLVTVFLSALSCWLCFRLMEILLHSRIWALIGTWLVVTNYHFVLTTSTFLREIPVVFAFLLFLYVIFTRKNKWVVGLALLLILDAKEHVFFTIAPGFLLWILLEEIYGKEDVGDSKTLKRILGRITAGFVPSFIYLILMFCTGIIPINMYNAYILGMIEGGTHQVLSEFRVHTATSNLWEGGKTIFQIPSATASSLPASSIRLISQKFVELINVALAYFGKILYPRLFSFISIPKIIVLPAIAMSFKMFRRCRGNTAYMLLPLILWVCLVIFFLRTTHGRYLFPIALIFMFFFIEFLRKGFSMPRFARNVLIATTLFVVSGLWIESNSLWIKISLNFLLLGLFWTALFTHQKRHKFIQHLTFALPSFIGIITLAVALSAFLLLGEAQLNNYLIWGHNRQSDIIVSHFKRGERIWTNYGSCFRLTFFNKERESTPEWNWKLKDYVPKKWLLNRYEDGRIFSFNWLSLKDFQEEIESSEITKIAFIASTYPEREFPMQNKLVYLMQSEWLELTKEVPLKNKILYIFGVKNKCVGDIS